MLSQKGRNYIILLFVVFNLTISAQTLKISLPKSFYRKFIGTLGKKEIIMYLTKSDSILYGTYHYKNTYTELEIQGKVFKKGTLVMDDKGNKGNFSGKFTTTTTMVGTWTDIGKTITLPFNLMESKTGVADIVWQQFDDDTCITRNERDSVFGDRQNDTCSHAYLNLFQIVIDNKEIQRKINGFIINAYCKDNGHDDDPKVHYGKASCIVYQLHSFVSDISMLGSGLEIKYEVITDDNNILSFQLFQWQNNVGAPGGGGSNLYNIDLKTGKLIALDDLFIRGYKDSLNSIAEKLWITQNDIKDTSDLGHYELNDNFSIELEGLDFEPIEWNAGLSQSQVSIPYKYIDKLIKPDGYLSRFRAKQQK
jgi:hypothetical protein